MTRQDFLSLFLNTYGTEPDYPFDNENITAVFRHASNRKWFAIAMKVPRAKFGFDSVEIADVVNLKLPPEMTGSFSPSDGVHPAYHMNKLHWVSVILQDTADETIEFLLSMSYDATRKKMKSAKNVSADFE